MNPSVTIIKEVARAFYLSVEDLSSRNRTKGHLLARRCAVFLLWNRTELTLAEIGELLGGRSPATISNAYQRAAEHPELLKRERILKKLCQKSIF